MKNWLPLWTIPVLVIFSIGTVWLRLGIVRMTYGISSVGREIEHAQQERELLLLKLAALRSPKRLETLAKTKFGYAPPRGNQMIHLKKSEISENDP